MISLQNLGFRIDHVGVGHNLGAIGEDGVVCDSTINTVDHLEIV